MTISFPRTNQYFTVTDDRYPDASHRTQIFKCIASDKSLVIAILFGSTYFTDSDKNRTHIFNRLDNKFYPVSQSVIRAMTTKGE